MGNLQDPIYEQVHPFLYQATKRYRVPAAQAG